jgi:hypothetical protein
MLETQVRPKGTQNQVDVPSFAQPELPNFVVHPPLLETLLAEQENIPAYSMLMGICDDGLPLVLDLTDPVAGSMLIVGDDEFYNTNLLHTLITSVTSTNTDKEINFHLISPFVNQIVTFQQDTHYKLGFEPQHPDCHIIVEEFNRLVKSRQKGESIVPIHILAIDNFDQLIANFSKDAIADLEWLIKNGPSCGVWVFATTSSEQMNNNFINPELFNSKIISQITEPTSNFNLPKNTNTKISKLVAGCEVLINHKKVTRHIWIPQLEDLGFGRSG